MIIASPALYLINTCSSSFHCSQDSGGRHIPSVFGFPLSRCWIFIFCGETQGLQLYIRCCSIYLSGLYLTGLRPKPQWCCLKEGEILQEGNLFESWLWKWYYSQGPRSIPPVFKLKHAKTTSWWCLLAKMTHWGWGLPGLVWRWNHPTGTEQKWPFLLPPPPTAALIWQADEFTHKDGAAGKRLLWWLWAAADCFVNCQH